jgi:hypothetical protein
MGSTWTMWIMLTMWTIGGMLTMWTMRGMGGMKKRCEHKDTHTYTHTSTQIIKLS